MNENKSFMIVAVGHYPAEHAEVTIRLQSQNPAKQLIELDCLVSAIFKKAKELQAHLQDAATPRIVAPRA